MYVRLTVGDHEQNGFVHVARWDDCDEATCREAIASIDALVDPEAEPDVNTTRYTFILDLMENDYSMLDNGKRSLPTQIASRLAPEAVSRWLDRRPEPDSGTWRTDRLPGQPA